MVRGNLSQLWIPVATGLIRQRPRKPSSTSADRRVDRRRRAGARTGPARSSGGDHRAGRRAAAPAARSSGIRVPRPVAWPTSQPCTVISRAAAETSSPAGTGRSPTTTYPGGAARSTRRAAAHALLLERVDVGAGPAAATARRATAPPAASVKASRASSMWASRSARVHPAQGVGPVAVAVRRRRARPGCSPGPARAAPVRGGAPGRRSGSPAGAGAGHRGTESAGSRAGRPNVANSAVLEERRRRAAPGRRRGRAPGGGTARSRRRSPACACRGRTPAGRWPWSRASACRGRRRGTGWRSARRCSRRRGTSR